MPTLVNAGSTIRPLHTDPPFRGNSRPLEFPQRAYLQLVSTLQTTLELNQLVELFFEGIRQFVPVDGIVYRGETHNLRIQLGGGGAHRCGYRLLTPRDNLGEMVFSRARRFSAGELETLEQLIGALIHPLRNAHQYRDAIQTALRDPLTGVGNRVALDNALAREIQMARRYEQSLSLAVVDIDHFKRINDTLGHSGGDKVLCEVANTIANNIRSTDQTFRYGGEEFVVLLSKTPLRGAGIIAERIRRQVEGIAIPVNDSTLRPSVSIGYSSLIPGESLESFFDRADNALYRAKESGRNRVLAGGG